MCPDPSLRVPVPRARCGYRAGNSIANVTFADAINETGWSFLHVTTSAAATNYEQAYAAGYAEGYITQHRIYQV